MNIYFAIIARLYIGGYNTSVQVYDINTFMSNKYGLIDTSQ